jgi:hypothetical protein
MADNNLFNLLLGIKAIDIIAGKDEEYVEPDPWPFRYKYTIYFRMMWSVITIVYINHVCEITFGLGPTYFSYFWVVPLAFIPFIGSFWLSLICILLLVFGLPSDPAMTIPVQCYSPGC